MGSLSSLRYLGHQNTQYQLRPTLLKNDAQVASGSETGELCIWDLLSAKIINRWQLHKSSISCVAWHEASGQLLTCSMDESCIVVKI